MTINKSVIILFLFPFLALTLAGQAKNGNAEEYFIESLRAGAFKHANSWVDVKSYPAYDKDIDYNLFRLNTLPILEDRVIGNFDYDNKFYYIEYFADNYFKNKFIYSFDGELAFVDFILYANNVKSFNDLCSQQINETFQYPYYVYRHNKAGYLNMVLVILKEKLYAFDKDQHIIYTCNSEFCYDIQGNKLIYKKIY